MLKIKNFRGIIIVLVLCLSTHFRTSAQAKKINTILDTYKINPSTISFHPKGEILLTTPYERETNSQYLLIISNNEELTIDTLENSRPNRAAFSEGGEYLIYNYYDQVSGKFHTVKRKYNGKEDIGYPIFLTGILSEENMYYYSMTENQDFYYYTYNYNDSTRRGIFYSRFENGNYHPQEPIIIDRANAVAYSPLLLNDTTMVVAQHGKIDDSKQGIHYLIKDEKGNWSSPVLIKNLPMSNVITYFDAETIALLRAKDSRIQLISKNDLIEMIEK